jgi:hypothetical protein
MMKRPEQRVEMELPDAAPAHETAFDDELCPRSALAKPQKLKP